MNAEVTSDGKTVWVNSAESCCIGRFSHFGIDIHHHGGVQMLTGQQCLDCRHGKPDLADWTHFKESMWRHFLVIVGDQHMPRFLQ